MKGDNMFKLAKYMELLDQIESILEQESFIGERAAKEKGILEDMRSAVHYLNVLEGAQYVESDDILTFAGHTVPLGTMQQTMLEEDFMAFIADMLSDGRMVLAPKKEQTAQEDSDTPEAQMETDAQNEALNEALSQKDAELAAGRSVEEEPVMTDPTLVDAALDTMSEQLGINSKKDLKKATESLVELNRSLGKSYTVYYDEPIDSRRKKAG